MLSLRKTRLALDSAEIHHARVVGREFAFVAEHGSHHHELWGTILGVKWSDEGGLKLFVSIPEFWSKRLLCLVYYGGRWHASLDIDEDELRQKLDALDEDDEEGEKRLIEEFNNSKFIPGQLVIICD